MAQKNSINAKIRKLYDSNKTVALPDQETAEDLAVKETLAYGGCAFTIITYNDDQGTTVNADRSLSTTFESSSESPLRYVGIEKTYTPAEAAVEIGNALRTSDYSQYQQSRLTGARDAFVALSQIFAQSGDSMHFVRDPYREVLTFVPLRKGEKVFDRAGKQIWPQPAP